MKKVILTLIAVIMVLPAAACAAPPAATGLVVSDKPRVTAPQVDAADEAIQVEGNSQFAFDLYQALKSKDGNLFYSPHSISLALAMAYAGARGETERQMAETLQFILPQDRLHPALNALDLELAKRGQGAQGKDDKGFRLNIANAIWGQKEYSFQSAYLDVLSQNYGTGLRTLDFIKETEKSRVTINDWVSQETEGRIKDLIPQGAIGTLTRLVLTNAIYFNAAWQHQFEKNATAGGPFNLLDGKQITVPIMRQSNSFGYTSGDGYQAVELDYDGGELSMVILLPESEKFKTFEDALISQRAGDIIRALRRERLALTMPGFQFDSSFSLKQTLAAMGMPSAFTDSADFSGMTGSRELSISDVIHKAFVAVDENGTEAAAATAVIVGVTSAPIEPPIQVNIDRPFIFLIRDVQTGAIIFVGRVLNPSN